jgi:chemotaxis protein methyltransferase CheR
MFDEAVTAEVVRHFCRIAAHRLGVSIGSDRHDLVASRVAKRMQALALGQVEYMEQLDGDHECTEVVRFLDLLRPRPPGFFARRDDLTALHAGLVRWLGEGKRRLRLWSAGCGTGEEAYSMALMALGAVEAAAIGLAEVDIKILATDISKPILERAEQGIFEVEQLRNVPRRLLGRYFHATEAGMAIDEVVKPMVHFTRLSLTNLPYPMKGPLDAIFCHQGLVPLMPSARRLAVNAARSLLAPHGLLCMGLSSQMLAEADDEDDVSGYCSGPRSGGHC